MPWTFAHPAAVLPLKRLCPRWLSFPALVVGSLMPDLSYYIPGTDFSGYAHTLAGCVLICLPCGLLVLGLLYALRGPLVHALPWPHREAFAPLARMRVAFTPALLRRVALSLAIGAATHAAWDACTHIRGGLVEQVAWLQAPVFTYRGFALPTYQALQHGSTLLGAALLIWAYCRWLRGLAIPDCTHASDEQWRYRALWCIAAFAFAGAFWLALSSIVGIRPDHVPAVFVREMAVQGAVLLATLYTAYAVVSYRRYV